MNLFVYQNSNFIWGQLLIEGFAHLGVQTVVSSPGSQCAPLTVSAAFNPKLKTVSILDERSAGFFALGVGKATQQPALLICTSGTAAANYWPAIIEAYQSYTPLIILTADRPAEELHSSARQTILQNNLYGTYTRLSHHLAEPNLDKLAYLREQTIHAYKRSLNPVSGPVHLNVPFPANLGNLKSTSVFNKMKGFDKKHFFETFKPTTIGTQQFSAIERLKEIENYKRGLVIANEYPGACPKAYQKALSKFAQNTQWPILTTSLSPYRYASPNIKQITLYEAFLKKEASKKTLKPDVILQIGTPPLPKMLNLWIQSLDVPHFILTNSSENQNPLHTRSIQLNLPVSVLKTVFKKARTHTEYRKKWETLEAKYENYFANHFKTIDWLSESKLTYLLAKNLPQKTPVFFSNSMPIRQADLFFKANKKAYRTFANLGVSGIDGITSTALGVAVAEKKPAVLVIGDLAFLHDTNGLLNIQNLELSLTIIVVNNQGGNIFEYTPNKKLDSALFETYFITKQAVDIQSLAKAHHIDYQKIDDWETFEKTIRVLPQKGVRILDFQSNRKLNTHFYKTLGKLD